jgi:hypothetical protein
MKADYNRHATPVSRDERIAHSPTGRHQPSFKRQNPGNYVCLGCRQSSESPGLYCEGCVMQTELRP